MPITIPLNAQLLVIPNHGEVAVFPMGVRWLAVYTTDAERRWPAGVGRTLAQAVANLLMRR